LSKGYQVVQSSHALAEFCFNNREIFVEWHNNSNYLCCLCVDKEEELSRLILKLTLYNIKFSVFREPDIGNQITAIAVEPISKEKHKQLFKKLKLTCHD
jgi:hypothetical protein